MKKPNFLKTRKEKQRERTVEVLALAIKLGLTVRQIQDNLELSELDKEQKRLENENLELKNQLLELKRQRELKAIQN